jgi:hypothetical protein
MSLSSRTKALIGSMAKINGSMFFLPTVVQRTTSLQQDVWVKAIFAEEFGASFPILDLSKLLNILSLHDDPKISLIGDKVLLIKGSDGRKFQYTLTDKNSIVIPPDEDFVLPPNPMVEFDMSVSALQTVCKHAAVADLTHVAIKGDEKGVYLTAYSEQNDTSDMYTEKMAPCDKRFTVDFKVHKITSMMENPYRVTVCKGVTRFVSDDITYWIAAETTSNYS